MVAIGIPVAGVGANQELFEIGESVVVKVERFLFVLNARVETLQDVRRGNFRADEYVARDEALEYELLAVLRLAVGMPAGYPDLRHVPEVVLPAVGEVVGVGVFKRRIHAGGSVRTAGLRAPEAEVNAIRILPVASICLFERRLVCVRLGNAERHDALGHLGLVEAVVEATQLKPVVERNPYRRIAILGRRVVRMAAD